MKVYYWTPYMGNVGTIKATINSAIALKKRGYEVRLYKPYREWEGYEEILEKNGIEVIDFGLSKIFSELPHKKIGFRFSMILISLFSYFKLKKNWEDEKPDVIMAYLLGFLPFVVRRGARHKPAIVNSIQGKPMFTSFRRWLWKRLYSQADQMIALSEATRKEILKNLDYPEKNIVVLPNPIIDDEIDKMAIEPLEKVFEEEKDTIILGVGRLTRQKDFSTLIRACDLVRKEYPCKLWILGEGESREKLQALISSLHMEDMAKLVGFVYNPYKYMKKADIFVLSSLWEDQGHALIEAAYMKMYLVSTKCPYGQEEFLDYGDRGELCEAQSPESMAQAIRNMLDKEKEEENRKKVQLAYKASLEYTLDQHGERLDILLKKCILREVCEEKN